MNMSGVPAAQLMGRPPGKRHSLRVPNS